MARFSPLFSGSSGNSIAVGGKDGYVLIDAGTNAKQISRALSDREFELEKLRGIFITHEHSDHIAAVRVLASRLKVPVYASEGTLCAMHDLGALEGVEAFVCSEGGVEVGGLFVQPFRTMHDANEPYGYTILTSDSRKVAVMTDTGCVSDDMRRAIIRSDLIYIESNHDVDMLRSSSYPQYLIRRILSTKGHLSNDDCARELPGLSKKGTARFILGHLSRENNMPMKARQTALDALCSTGMREDIDFTLQVAAPDGLPVTVF